MNAAASVADQYLINKVVAYDQQYNNNGSGNIVANQTNKFDNNSQMQMEMKRSKARIKELQKHIDISNSTQMNFNSSNSNQNYH